MGHMHDKENTFARAPDNMGFVSKDDIMKVTKVHCKPKTTVVLPYTRV